MTTQPDHAESASRPLEAGAQARLGAFLASGLRYWEPRRLLYNAALAAVILVHFAAAWPESREHLSLDLVLMLFFLCVLANICYCAVYVADVFLQLSGLQRHLRAGRRLLFFVGTAFAATIAHFLARGYTGGP